MMRAWDLLLKSCLSVAECTNSEEMMLKLRMLVTERGHNFLIFSLPIYCASKSNLHIVFPRTQSDPDRHS